MQKGDQGENGWSFHRVPMQQFSISRIILSSTSFKKLLLGSFLVNLQVSVDVPRKLFLVIFFQRCLFEKMMP